MVQTRPTGLCEVHRMSIFVEGSAAVAARPSRSIRFPSGVNESAFRTGLRPTDVTSGLTSVYTGGWMITASPGSVSCSISTPIDVPTLGLTTVRSLAPPPPERALIQSQNGSMTDSGRVS